MKTGTAHIIALQFKLRIFRVYNNVPTIMLNDNESAVNNSSKIESTLDKKQSSIYYHLVHHNVAAVVIKIVWILTTDNVTDALTKRLMEANSKLLFGYWNY